MMRRKEIFSIPNMIFGVILISIVSAISIVSIISIPSQVQAQINDLSNQLTPGYAQGYLYANSNLSSIPWASQFTSTLANQYTTAFSLINQGPLNLDLTSYNQTGLNQIGLNQTSLNLSELNRLGSFGGSYWPAYSSSWLNYPPIMGYGPEVPIVTKAGQSASTYLWVIDPDWDLPLFSSSLGATGRDTQGRPIWEFNTNFPGVYTTNILAYDQRGGFSSFLAPVIVKPWWSF